jgi:ribose 5-phosphate isomerase B
MNGVSRIAVGCDHGGWRLKEIIIGYLRKKGLCVLDMGTFSEESMDYPDTAYKVARAVAAGRAARGILICKSGIGNCIVANKVAGVRAALCHQVRAARLSRQHNDAMSWFWVLFLSRGPGQKDGRRVARHAFEGGRHARRLKKIERIEKLCARP